MSTLEKSLKKQIELLQAEVELYANALDNLAARLEPFLAAQEKPAEVDTSQMVPVDVDGKPNGEKKPGRKSTTTA